MAMRIGFFSDDVGASHAAALFGHGLAQLGGKVTVVAPPYRLDPGERACAHGGVLGISLPHRGNPYDLQCMLEGLPSRDADCAVALPLSGIRDGAVRNQFDAVVTVGRDQPAAARALREARYDVSENGRGDGSAGGPGPAWFLVGASQSVLRTQASLFAARGPALPFAVRSLPTTLPRLGAGAEAALFAGHPDRETIRSGILLAALVVAVVADPHARRIDEGTLAGMMAARDLSGDRATSDHLVGLASAYERYGEPSFEIGGTARASRPTVARRGIEAYRRRGLEDLSGARISPEELQNRRERHR